MENNAESGPGDNTLEANGFKFCGTTLPETVLELILLKVGEEDVFTCNLVCRAWKAILSQKYLWKKRFESKQIDWNEIPSHIQDRPGAWAVFYSHLRHQILTKNYVDNPSGHRELEGWTLPRNHLDNPFLQAPWEIEEEPLGCDPLPQLLFYGRNDRCCFTPTIPWCTKSFIVDLKKEGLTPDLLKLLVPFKINFSQMCAAATDNSSGWMDWELTLLNSERQVILKIKPPPEFLLPNGTWKTARFSFQIVNPEGKGLKDLQFIQFTHEGRTNGIDGRPKLARSSVTFECLG